MTKKSTKSQAKILSERAMKAHKTRGAAGRKAAAIRAHATRAANAAAIWEGTPVAVELVALATERAKLADKVKPLTTK